MLVSNNLSEGEKQRLVEYRKNQIRKNRAALQIKTD